MKYLIYKKITSIIPPGILSQIASYKSFRKTKAWLMGSEQEPALMEGKIIWEDISFFFTAPHKTFHQAQTKGIENIICRLARKTLLEFTSPVTAIDVGANYGFVSMVMGKSANSESKIISIEIDPYISAVIKKTISENNLQNITTLISKGAGAEDKENQITLDELFNSQPFPPVKFIKIDVDGADYQVLVGAENLLRRYTPVVVIEMTRSQKEIYEMLKSCGYYYFIGQDNKPVTPGIWPENLIASAGPISLPGHFI